VLNPYGASSLTVAANTFGEIIWPLWLSPSMLSYYQTISVTATSSTIPSGTSINALKFRVVAEPKLNDIYNGSTFKQTLNTAAMSNWSPAVSSNGTMTLTFPGGYWTSDADFSANNNAGGSYQNQWFYPGYALTAADSVGSSNGILIQARALNAGQVHLLVYEQNGTDITSYRSTYPIIPTDYGWHAQFVPYSSFMALKGATDPNGKLDAANIITVAVGMDSTAVTNKLEISNLYLVNQGTATLTSVTSSSPAKVVWTDVAGENSYCIERKTGANGTYTQVGFTAANVTTFWDTSVASATTYTYRVKPSNGGYSNLMSVTTPTFSTLLNENFNATTTGSLPGGWTKTTPTNTTVNGQAYPSATNKSIKLYDNSTAGLCSVEKTFTASTDWIFASFSFYASANGATFQVRSGTTVAVDLLLKNGNLIYRNASGTETTIMPYAVNTWYSVKIVPSVSLKTFDLYVGGALKLKGGAFRNNVTTLDRINFGTDSAQKCTTYVDDVFIQK
jgi:hypothetical protein